MAPGAARLPQTTLIHACFLHLLLVWLLSFRFSNSIFFILSLRLTLGVVTVNFHAAFMYSFPIVHQFLSASLLILTHLFPTKRTMGLGFPICGKLYWLPVSERSDHQSRTVSQVFIEVLEVGIANINKAVLPSILPLVPKLRQPGKSMGADNL